MEIKILVACVGNIFLGDDAFGTEMANRLSERSLPAGVKVIDFGIRSYDLAYSLMGDWDLVILVDALPLGGRPGTLYTVEAELPTIEESSNLSANAHTMNPVAVLQMVRQLGGTVGRVLVVGVEPETVEPHCDGHIGLSAAVSVALDEAVGMVEQLIKQARNSATAA